MKRLSRFQNMRERIRRMFLPRSLRYQLLSRSLLILLGLFVLIGGFQYVLMEQFLYKNRAASIQSQIHATPLQAWQQLARGVSEHEDYDGDKGKDSNPLRLPDSTIAFVAPDGTFTSLYEDPNHGPAPQMEQSVYQQAFQSLSQHQDPPYQLVKNAQGEEQLVVLSSIGGHGSVLGLIQVSTSVHPLWDVLGQQLAIFTGLSVVALVVGLFAFLPVLRRTLVPLSSMTDAVERINAGNLDERLPAQLGQMEVERLAASFNAMLERLEVSFEAEKEAKEQMRRFVADASHELRTPLTSIHGFLEVLLRGAASNPVQLERALQSMYGESKRLTKLVQDLLELARLDQAPAFQMKKGRLDAVVLEMEPQLRMLAGDRQVDVSVADDVTATFDPDRMKQVVLNLFQNAVQHTDPLAGEIRLALTKDAARDGLILTVRDNGAGISEEHLAHLFDRFYRVDTARSRVQGGAGLGLAITKSILDLHGGTIHCESVLGEGTLFRVWLPTVPPPFGEKPEIV